MKNRPFTAVLLCFLIQALSGCSSFDSEIVPTSTEKPWTKTSTPTHLISVDLPTLTPLPVIVQPATLRPDQTNEFIKERLQYPIDCDAPCLWGIVPGKTTINEALNILSQLGLESKRIDYAGLTFHTTESRLDNGLSLTITLTDQDGMVQNLRFDILPEIQKKTVRQWLAYSPETLTNRYGLPSKVTFALDWGPRSYFEMDIYFDQADLIVEYIGHDVIPRQKAPAKICPLSSQYELVRIWMGKNPYQPPAKGVLLPEATQLTVQEFAKLMSGPAELACFTINDEVFQ